MISPDVYSKVKHIMDKYGIPEHIWLPIAIAESGGNPYAVNETPYEKSIGLFQINLYAHPEFETLDLMDPEVNAEVAAQHFLRPAYEKVKNLDPETQTVYVWKEGIQPEWNAQKEQYIKSLIENMDEIKPHSFGVSRKWNESQSSGILGWIENKILLPIKTGLIYAITYIIIVVLIIVSFYIVFKPEEGKS